MYLIIPLCAFIISIFIITYIISRKFVYLRKLAPEVLNEVDSKQAYWSTMFPEIAEQLSPKNIQAVRVKAFGLWSKILSKFQLVWRSVDTWVNKQSILVRSRELYHRKALSLHQKEEENDSIAEAVMLEDPKMQEQDLILKIARDPKDAKLYKELGKLYVTMREWNDAMESYTKALELDSEDKQSFYEREKIRKKINL